MKSFKELMESELNLEEGFKFKKPNTKDIKARFKKLKNKSFLKKLKSKKIKKPKSSISIVKKLKKKAIGFFKALGKRLKLSEKYLVESEEAKIKALADMLDIDSEDIEDEIEVNSWGFDAEGGEYMVLDDAEADEAVKAYIEDSLWAFNTSWLLQYFDEGDVIDHHGIDRTFMDEDEDGNEIEVEMDDDQELFYMAFGDDIESWLSQRQSNEADGGSLNQDLMNYIGDMDNFVSDSIGADGRGHFLSGYDGEEEESGKYFIYRTN